MPGHDTPLIAIIAIGLAMAFVLGLAAHRLRVSPLVGYLLAGIVVGPFTPGFVADQGLANELAEIGVILLMFAVGLHFSLKDLMSVRTIALPGAVVQIAVATLLGMALAWSLGWTMGAGIIFGLALSVASTVVLIRALQERRILETERGRIAVGWLIVEDLVMVLALVMLPALSGALGGAGGTASWQTIAWSAGITLVKVATFVAIMLIAGRRIVPWIMHYAAHTGSRELFRLSVYAVALGIAYGAAALFGVSFALGAFFAGMVLAESPLSQRATEEALPLRDAFAVLFFVSVGMLFDPGVLIRSPWSVLGTVAIIIVGKTIAAFLIVKAFGRSNSTALTISASLAQIGEFSFILAGLGVSMGVLPTEGRDLILAGAIISILLNPFVFMAFEKLRPAPKPALAGPGVYTPAAPETEPAKPLAAVVADEEAVPLKASSLTGHDVIVGYGRVGSLVGSGLRAAGRPVLVFEERLDEVAAARRDGAEVFVGNAADPRVLATANLHEARRLFVTVPEAFEAGQVVEQARAANPGLEIIARAHTSAAVGHLEEMGCSLAVMGEHEIAMRMLEHVGVDEAPPGSGADKGVLPGK
ncbi:CPA2 family monovalent cation:H+ antiporter-2 [Skermanella aerolata]|uniref:Sodium:proton antiporter n=1 Tax=Skermanella aerolata TaxID=393310 RepID=A0A512DRC5_9PROT|nr:YbaL family putative K(+) efflux transporter [Skermanella aerolata]KJB92528.1 sodium:proton antiporter [Skermanella aerolata KACC 11604]GEO39038.1 sodium:proton antiporter [Skermanella aerolata]